MLKLGCNLPNMANICLHKSTDAKFYPFTERDEDLDIFLLNYQRHQAKSYLNTLPNYTLS